MTVVERQDICLDAQGFGAERGICILYTAYGGTTYNTHIYVYKIYKYTSLSHFKR